MHVEVNISVGAIEIGLGNKAEDVFFIFTFVISPVSPPLYVQVRQKGESFAFPLAWGKTSLMICTVKTLGVSVCSVKAPQAASR